MTGVSRRHFLSLTGSAAAVAFTERANAAMGPNDKFDLVIKGGDVLDPSQSLRGKRDIGIRWGVIEAIENEIPAARASKTIDASGKLVTPGLIDLHCHVYPYGSAIGIPADELVQFQGTTTVVSAGDAGVNNLAALRRYIVAQTRARMYAFLHIANNGISSRRRGRGCTLSFISPITVCRHSRWPNSTTSTMRRSKPAPWRSRKTRIS